MVYAVGVADAGIALAGGTERRAGDDGDLLFPQQLLAELAAGQAADLDRREHVERAPRLKAGQAHLVQRLDDVAAAAVVLVAHHLDLVVALAQRRDGRVLARGRRGHDAALVDLRHDFDKRCRTGGVAEPPAGHGVGLGEAVDHNRALRHAGQRRNRNVAVQAVGQLGVNFVGQHQHIRLAQDGGDLLHLGGTHDCARGVVGIREDQQLRPGRDGRAQLVGGQAELILGAGGNMHGHAAGQLGDRLIADKARLRDDDLIPGLDHRTDGQVDGLAAADGDQDVILFIVQIKAAL